MSGLQGLLGRSCGETECVDSYWGDTNGLIVEFGGGCMTWYTY